MVGEGGSGGGGWGGGGSKYYGHYKMTPPPPPPLQNSRCYLASPVYTFEWFIHIILSLIHKTLWLVKEAVVVERGGVKILWPIIK